MAGALTEHVWRPSSAERIEADLACVWQELARTAPVSRAVMSNLIVFCRCPTGRRVELASMPEEFPVEEVTGQHPARVIVLRHDPDVPDRTGTSDNRNRPDQPGAAAAGATAVADALVGVLTFGPPDARYGVEQIVVRSACAEAALPSIVRPLLLGDIPTSVWWTDDFSGTPPLGALVALGRQLLYDSRRWRDVPATVAALAPLLADRFGPDLADLNWRRLSPMRRAFAHALESSDRAAHPWPASIRITHRPGESALAWLLAGWLQHAGSGGAASPAPEPPIGVAETAQQDDDLVTLLFGDAFEMRLDSRRVIVADARGPAPFTVAVRQETDAEAIAAELRMLARDGVYHDTLRALVRRFSGA